MLVVGDVSGGVRGSCEGGKALVQVRGGWFRCEGVDSGAVGGGAWLVVQMRGWLCCGGGWLFTWGGGGWGGGSGDLRCGPGGEGDSD